MNREHIKTVLKTPSPPPVNPQKYAVLLPVFPQKDGLHLLFEIRSHHLKNQPGEICFPGGRWEAGEEYWETAIRETCEELGVCSDQIELLGAATPLRTPFNVTLYPYVGYLNNFSFPDSIAINPDEVDSFFTVPLSWFMENPPEIWNVASSFIFPEDFPYHLIQNGRDYQWKSAVYPIHFYVYENNVIWGMTARIIKEFCDRLR